MRVSGGSQVDAMYTHLGFYQSASGEVEIIGEGSTWTTDFAFNVGWAGEGDLEIRNGGRVESAAGRIAGHADGAGHARAIGESSAWHASELDVGGDSGGAGGEGTLTLLGLGSLLPLACRRKVYRNRPVIIAREPT